MKRLSLAVHITIICLLLAAPVLAADTEEIIKVQLGQKALLTQNGQVALPVWVACPAGGQILEAFVYVTQDGHTSQFAGIPVVCDNRPHGYLIRVSTFPETPFHRGEANATAYVLLTTGHSGGDTGPITIR